MEEIFTLTLDNGKSVQYTLDSEGPSMMTNPDLTLEEIERAWKVLIKIWEKSKRTSA